MSLPMQRKRGLFKAQVLPMHY